MRLAPLAALLLPAAAALSGCGNPCQQLCDVVAEVYDQCGKEYDPAEVQECRQRYIAPSEAELDTCRYGITTDREGVTNFEKDVTCDTLEDWEIAFGASSEG